MDHIVGWIIFYYMVYPVILDRHLAAFTSWLLWIELLKLGCTNIATSLRAEFPIRALSGAGQPFMVAPSPLVGCLPVSLASTHQALVVTPTQVVTTKKPPDISKRPLDGKMASDWERLLQTFRDSFGENKIEITLGIRSLHNHRQFSELVLAPMNQNVFVD